MKMLFEVKVAPHKRPFTFKPGTKQPIRSGVASQKATYAQIISYATEAQLYQHRDFYYTVYVWRDCARLMRWDRAGVVLSEPFNWHADRDPLLTFMYAFAMATPQQQGYSSHAERATEADVLLLKSLQKHVTEKAAAVTKLALAAGTGTAPTADRKDAGTGPTEEDRKHCLHAAYFAEMLHNTNKWPVYKVCLLTSASHNCIERFVPR